MGDVDRTSAVVQFACIALCTFWTVLIGMWVANAVHHRKTPSIPLFRVILQMLTVQWLLAWCTLAQAALYRFGLSGSQVTPLQIIRLCLGFIFTCYLFFVFLLLAKGWSIIRYRLARVEYRGFYGLAFAILCVALLMGIDTGFYVVALVFFDLVVIRLMFVNADESIRWLEDAAHRANIQDNLMLFNAAHNKLKLLRTPKYLVVFFTVGTLLAEVLSFFLYPNEPIVRYLFEQIVVVPTVAVLCIRFRLRDFTAYYPPEPTSTPAEQVSLQSTSSSSVERGLALSIADTNDAGFSVDDAAAAAEAEGGDAGVPADCTPPLGTFDLPDLRGFANRPASQVLAVLMPDAIGSGHVDDVAWPLSRRPLMLATPAYGSADVAGANGNGSRPGLGSGGAGSSAAADVASRARAAEGFAGLGRPSRQTGAGQGRRRRHRHQPRVLPDPAQFSGNVLVPAQPPPAPPAAPAPAPAPPAPVPPVPQRQIQWYPTNHTDPPEDNTMDRFTMAWLSGPSIVHTRSRDNTYLILGRMLQPM